MAAVPLSETTFWNIECVFSPLQACRYLSYLVYPLCIGGAVFSLVYLRQRRWDSGLTRWLSGFTLICKMFVFFPSQLLLVVDQHSGDWWVHVHARLLLKQTVFVTFSPLAHLRLLTSSQEFTPLASSQWRLSCLSIARSVLRCHGNIPDCANQQMNDRLTPLCVPPSCLDQLKSVGHLPKAVLMYRVSVK